MDHSSNQKGSSIYHALLVLMWYISLGRSRTIQSVIRVLLRKSSSIMLCLAESGTDSVPRGRPAVAAALLSRESGTVSLARGGLRCPLLRRSVGPNAVL